MSSKKQVLQNIESSLACPEFWERNHQEWNVINYYKKLISVNPTVTKRTAATLLNNDLKELEFAFISNKDILKKIKSIHVEVKKSTSIIIEFWNNHSNTLKKIALENSVQQTIIARELRRQASNEIVGSSSAAAAAAAPPAAAAAAAAVAITASTETASTKTGTSPSNPSPIKRLRTNKENELVESDNVFVSGCDVSVGTTIKRAAYQLHEKNQPMSCRERKIMTSGLSSILDLSDNSFDSQRSLFTQKQWEELHARYDPMW